MAILSLGPAAMLWGARSLYAVWQRGRMEEDDLQSFRAVADRLQLEHQVCQFHLRRWVGSKLGRLRQTVPRDWLGVAEQVQLILQELPVDGDRQLLRLYRQVAVPRQGRGQRLSPVHQLRGLLIRLSENWPRFRDFDWQPEVSWSNKGTEQIIGRLKIRARTVRGYKSTPGMLAALLLAGMGQRQ